eukprot:12431531-Karenia_brevis.AAC.3
MACTTRCCGTTRRGKQCSLTSDSKLQDDYGCDVADPLRKGSPYCLFHIRPFSWQKYELRGPVVVIFIDIETTGLNIARDRIVEIGAASSNGCFQTVIRPDIPNQSTVHGITDDELNQGPSFPIAWERFVDFAEKLMIQQIHESGSEDSEDDDLPRLPRPPDEPPSLLLAAHNGVKFDFALLLCECFRHGLSLNPMKRWYFVDTLWVMQSLQKIGSCLKLQCLTRCIGGTNNLQAHRALDDCLCLREVIEHSALRLGTNICGLLKQFAVQLDAESSVAQVCALLPDT